MSDPPTMARGQLTPCTIIITPSMPARAADEPTDRSMPAVIITNVMPMATMAVTVVCTITLNKLLKVKKTGEANERYTKTRISAPAAASCAARSTNCVRSLPMKARLKLFLFCGLSVSSSGGAVSFIMLQSPWLLLPAQGLALPKIAHGRACQRSFLHASPGYDHTY